MAAAPALPDDREGMVQRLSCVDDQLTQLRQQLRRAERYEAPWAPVAGAEGAAPAEEAEALVRQLCEADIGAKRRRSLDDPVLAVYRENHRRKALSSQPFRLDPASGPPVEVPPLDDVRAAQVRDAVLRLRARDERCAARLARPPPKRLLVAALQRRIGWPRRSSSAPAASAASTPDTDGSEASGPGPEEEQWGMELAEYLAAVQSQLGPGTLEGVLQEVAEGSAGAGEVPAALLEWLGTAEDPTVLAPDGKSVDPQTWIVLLLALLDEHAARGGTQPPPLPALRDGRPARRGGRPARGQKAAEPPAEPSLWPRPPPPADWATVAAVPPHIQTLEQRRRTTFLSHNGHCQPEDVVKAVEHQRANETAWTPSECKTFLAKFRQYGKYFRGIAEYLPRKDTSDVVAHYYRIKHQDPMPALRREVKVRARRLLQQMEAQQRRAEKAGRERPGAPHRFAQRVSPQDGLTAFLADGAQDSQDPEALQQLQLELQLDLQNRPRTRRQTAAVR